MKVCELIAHLQLFDPLLEVKVSRIDYNTFHNKDIQKVYEKTIGIGEFEKFPGRHDFGYERREQRFVFVSTEFTSKNYGVSVIEEQEIEEEEN